MRVSDFYCGAGGFSEGFRQAGFELCFAVDKWEPAINTYRANKPQCKVIQDDVIRISYLPDDEFNTLIPDTEVIIGSPPCVAFSNSNKSGNGDKVLGIKLIEAFLRIVARKKFKENSILRYWVLENVPNVQKYIEKAYHAQDLGLDGDFVLRPLKHASIYNAKHFGAPTNRKRFLCGDFPPLVATHKDESVITLGKVLDSLKLSGDPEQIIQDINYPDLALPANQVSDHNYVCELQPFEWKTAKRLKEDRGYMGKMSFPEKLDAPARTVMATMSSSSRESMILELGKNRYRLPTVREAASMMSFPIDYKFYGKSKGIKHTLVGNAVPPKLSYAIAKAIAVDSDKPVPNYYFPIEHNQDIPFIDLNGKIFPKKEEKPKRSISKFKYHIPYMVIHAYRVELTNYHSNFETKTFYWNAEIHYSQGRRNARKYEPLISSTLWDDELYSKIDTFIAEIKDFICGSFNEFQEIYCMTSADRSSQRYYGPYELLESVKTFIINSLHDDEMEQLVQVSSGLPKFPKPILLGYYIINCILEFMK
jgi:DNA (cytosine-5)-methyltransferase 1